MKRGKDDDKIMGPMFPRLHVNDAGKGGPRAPPRNKMALYEQLTIPSQRYSSGAVPLNPNTNNSLVPSTSTNQLQGFERNTYFPLYRPPLAPSSDELQVRHPQLQAVSLSNQRTQQVENRKKPVEEDEFTVPIFSQPGMGHSNGKSQNSMMDEERERLTDLSSNHQVTLSNPNNPNAGLLESEHVMNQDERQHTSVRREHQQKHKLSRVEKSDHSSSEGASDQLLENTHQETSLNLKHDSRIECGYNGASEIGNRRMQRIEDDHSLERENVERGDDVSETSMVDFASGLDISPDDVVAIIGQKRFWKARTAILKQQRVFAIQVFELHRLLKVQKLIAGSPNLLLEDSGFVGKSSLEVSTVKKYSSDYAPKALAHSIKQKKDDDLRKQDDKMEGTAENAVSKALIPPQNPPPPLPLGHNNPHSASPPVNVDPKVNPWSFPQPGPHQWLVPVMSPTEGLVYKPYPAPGFMGPDQACEGYGPGPMGPSPMMGGLMNPSLYGIPTPHYHHFGGQGYFPPYGMPMVSPGGSGSAVDQMNQFSGSNPYSCQMAQPHQSSCNMPSQKNRTTSPPVVRGPPAKKGGELHSSTASSPSERTQGPGPTAPPPTEERDPLPLFPVGPTIEVSEEAPRAEKRARVIRVIPHNPRSTKESAARIFQSIQEERRQHESN